MYTLFDMFKVVFVQPWKWIAKYLVIALALLALAVPAFGQCPACQQCQNGQCYLPPAQTYWQPQQQQQIYQPAPQVYQQQPYYVRSTAPQVYAQPITYVPPESCLVAQANNSPAPQITVTVEAPKTAPPQGQWAALYVQNGTSYAFDRWVWLPANSATQAAPCSCPCKCANCTCNRR